MADVSERSPLLGPPPAPRRASARRDGGAGQEDCCCISRRSLVCLLMFLIGCCGVIAAILLSLWQLHTAHPINVTTKAPEPRPSHGAVQLRQTSMSSNSLSLSIMSLMVWGSPGSFGTKDKELRIEAIGNLTHRPDVDVFILSDLWMRPDHAKILQLIPEGHDMSSVEDLSLSSCDGNIAPEFCSGLALVTKFPVLDIEFTPFEVSGDLLWDYEYFLRRGVGRARIEPQTGVTVDLFVTSLASMDYNYWYREHQVAQLLEIVDKSTAMYVVVAGDFNVDPRDGETTYKSVSAKLKDAVEEYYKDDKTKWLEPALSTLGNPNNTYTSKGSHPVIYDYIWYRPGQGKAMSVDKYQVPILRTKGEKEVSLSTHEAVLANLKLT